MAKTCFCGCGREVPFGRKRLTNMLGARLDTDLAMFEGALERAPDPEHDAELQELVATGRPIRDGLRDILHGTLDRKDFDKEAGQAWLERAGRQRGRLAMEVVQEDYAGWNGHNQAELLLTGIRANAEIVGVQDTGMTVNDDPRVLVRLRVKPEGADPFEIERKVLVSRVAVPRRGEQVEVAYDPKEPTNFTFRMADLTDGSQAGADDPLEKLERLGALRDKGVLTQAEFESAKRQLLDEGL